MRTIQIRPLMTLTAVATTASNTKVIRSFNGHTIPLPPCLPPSLPSPTPFPTPFPVSGILSGILCGMLGHATRKSANEPSIHFMMEPTGRGGGRKREEGGWDGMLEIRSIPA